MKVANSAGRVRFARALCWIVAAATSVSTLGTARAELVFGVTSQNALVSWDRATPGTFAINVPITGLSSGESIVGMDFRPANGQLYGIGSSSRVYTINITTGVATAVGGSPFSPALNGGHFGVDFNPVADRMREVSNTNQNQRLTRESGQIAATDGSLFYADGDTNDGRNPQITHIAYTNNFPGAESTTLYGIDTKRNVLVTINPPNDGELETVGSIGLNLKQAGGFDIASSDGFAFAALDTTGPGKSRFYQINLQTGQATLIGAIGGGDVSIRAMSIVIPGPSVLLALACGLLLCAPRRRMIA